MAQKIENIRITTTFAVIAKVKSKSNLNKFRNGKGQLFSIDFADDSGAIRMVFFNDLATKFFDKIEVSVDIFLLFPS